MPSVIHHQRRPDHGHVSIERLFEGVRHELSDEWNVRTSISPCHSHGLIPRVKNLQAVSKLQADVHHIVGDVHYLAMALPEAQLMITIHDCAALERLKGLSRELLRQLWFVQPMKRARIVTTISETTKKELRRWTGDMADKVIVIPNCVRAEFQADPKVLNSKCPVILQVGTGWNKNVERVARAVMGLPCRLDIVGQLDPLQRSVLEASRVHYRELGRISDEALLEAYKNSDLLIFASLYEGFGLPILEAQAIGRPVITSNRSSLPEAAGEGALLVDPENCRDIRQAVLGIIEDPMLREKITQAGFSNVVKYTPSSIAELYSSAYHKIIALYP